MRLSSLSTTFSQPSSFLSSLPLIPRLLIPRRPSSFLLLLILFPILTSLFVLTITTHITSYTPPNGLNLKPNHRIGKEVASWGGRWRTVGEEIQGLSFARVRLLARDAGGDGGKEEGPVGEKKIGVTRGWFETPLMFRNPQFPPLSSSPSKSFQLLPSLSSPDRSTSYFSSFPILPISPIISYLFPSLYSPSRFLPTHLLSTFPRHVALSPSAPKEEEFLFSVATTSERARMLAPLWRYWLTKSGEEKGSALMVVLDIGEKGKEEELERWLRKEMGIKEVKVVIDQTSERYELRVLRQIPLMQSHSIYLQSRPKPRRVKWFVIGDDDTFWVDMRMLRRRVQNMNSLDDWFVGSVSESLEAEWMFGKMAFGGGGMIISESLMDKMEHVWDDCHEKFFKTFGGDEMISRCAGLAAGSSKEDILTQDYGMHQFDIRGSGSGFLQAGIPSFLTLHHLVGDSWIRLFPSDHPIRSRLDQLALFAEIATFLGGDNLFQRYVFGEGKAVMILGYSVTFYEHALSSEDLSKMEWTWDENYSLVYETRRGLPNLARDNQTVVEERGGNRKVDYFIEYFEKVGEGSAWFTFVSETKDRVNIFWEDEVKEEIREVRFAK